MDYDDMEIQQFIQGPQDEHDLDGLLGGAYSPPNMKETNSTDEVMPAIMEPGKDGTSVVSAVDLLEYIPNSDWRLWCGPRAPRKRRMLLSTEQMLPCNHFGDLPSASKGPKHRLIKNNKHWTLKEVTKLVDGVEDYGAGRWTLLKEKKFLTSVRTAEHLKDKWRNLLKAYNNGNAKGRFLVPLDKTLIERIKKLATVHPYPKSRRTFI